MSDRDPELDRLKQKKMEGMIQRRLRSQKPNGKPLLLTDTNFSSEISKNPVVLVDFWAAWCGPCRIVSPIIEQLAREYSGQIVFGKLNVDENPLTANQFQVQSIPTLLIFQNGEAVDGIIGAVPKSRIEAKIKPYLPDHKVPVSTGRRSTF